MCHLCNIVFTSQPRKRQTVNFFPSAIWTRGLLCCTFAFLPTDGPLISRRPSFFTRPPRHPHTALSFLMTLLPRWHLSLLSIFFTRPNPPNSQLLPKDLAFQFCWAVIVIIITMAIRTTTFINITFITNITGCFNFFLEAVWYLELLGGGSWLKNTPYIFVERTMCKI